MYFLSLIRDLFFEQMKLLLFSIRQNISAKSLPAEALRPDAAQKPGRQAGCFCKEAPAGQQKFNTDKPLIRTEKKSRPQAPPPPATKKKKKKKK
jgi:hypothetical protein